MSKRDWLANWRHNEIGFHQIAGNALLHRFWPDLALAEHAPVLVPLCGKSHDLLWLAERGHPVMGVELSPIAINAFFSENGLAPKRSRQGRFTIWHHGNIRIFEGDLFDLRAEHVAHVAMVYDRASLTALPEAQRLDYSALMQRILPATSRTLLLTIESPEGDVAPPPYQVDAEVLALYGGAWDIALLHGEGILEEDPDAAGGPPLAMEAKVYLLAPRPLPS